MIQRVSQSSMDIPQVKNFVALFGSCFSNGLFSAVITALSAYPVIENRRSAIGTDDGGTGNCFVVGSAFIPSGSRNFVFWMWHNKSDIRNLN